MNEPIPVSLAVRAVERAIRDCDAATPGPWRSIDYGAIRGGPMRMYARGASDSQIALATITHNDNAIEERDANAAFIVLARAGFRASLEYLRLMLGMEDRDYPVNEWIAQAVAPLIDHYDRVAPGWRTE